MMIAAGTMYDVVVIGSGPAGRNAALEAAGHGARVLVVERDRQVGGACVRYGTIPSKTLRETSVVLSALRRRSGGVCDISHDSRLAMASLMTRLDQVVHAHHEAARQELDAAGIETISGQAGFVSTHRIAVTDVHGRIREVTGESIIIATGSRPRHPDHIEVDHENILDSDSILAMTYLPRSLAIVGGGVIACEYASTFAALGVQVTLIDRSAAPLGFLEPDLVRVFLSRFQAAGGTFRGGCPVRSVCWDGISSVQVTLESGETVSADKALIAQGRVACLDLLNIENAGLSVTDRGLLAVDDCCRTNVPHIYAVGDAIGPPALASTSMEQGRQAACHALTGRNLPAGPVIPTGIYTIPEIATVGLTEQQAAEQSRDVMTATVPFDRLARAHIMASSEGLLRLVADEHGSRILGVQIAGEGAAELIHPGQMALTAGMTVDALADSIFNFPTLAEAYRLAALDLIRRRDHGRPAVGAAERPGFRMAAST